LIRNSIIALALSLAAAAVLAAEPSGPRPASAANPATRPATTQSAGPPRHPFAVDDPVPETRRQAEVRKLFDFLLSEYAGLLDKSKDRVSRSLILVCMSRIVRDDATEKILSMLEAEKDALVKVTAWQAMLARAKWVSPEQHRRWVAASVVLIKADALRGTLKAPAAQLLATAAPDRNTKEAWRVLFAHCDSRDPRDAPVIEALGQALANWHSADLVEWLLGRLLEPQDAVRADRILRIAGSEAPRINAGGAELRHAAREATGEHRKWWNRAKPSWEEARAASDGAWRELKPQFIPAPQAIDQVNPLDKDWRKDLELQAPNLKAFDVGFVVDATGSMTPVLEWLRRDLAKMLQGFGAVAVEARIGLTFYRDHDDAFVATTKPLTSRIPDLLKVLSQMRAEGGGDIPEAVLEGLQDCLRRNMWTQQPKARKIMILIGDAPPHEETIKQCVTLARQAAQNGFKVYAVKCSMGSDELQSFDDIAAAGGGTALSVEMLELAGAMSPQTYEKLAEAAREAAAREAAKRGDRPATRRPDDPGDRELKDLMAQLPPRQDPRPAGHRLLSRVLIDVINPQFKERIDPMVGILWEMLEESARETAQDGGRL
jgi:Mg-chelatase subunit ChlD